MDLRPESLGADTPDSSTPSLAMTMSDAPGSSKSLARLAQGHRGDPGQLHGRRQYSDQPVIVWHNDFVKRTVLNRQRLWQVLTTVPPSLAVPLDSGDTGLRTPENFKLTYSAVMATTPIPTRANAGTILAIRDEFLRDHIEDEFKFCAALAVLLGVRWSEKKRPQDGEAWFTTMYALGRELQKSIEKNGWTPGAIWANLSFGTKVDDSMMSLTQTDMALGLFTSPLAEYWADRVSRLNYCNSEHVVQSLRELKMRGGASFIGSQFQADMIHRIDLESASKKLRKPILERPDPARIVASDGLSDTGRPSIQGTKFDEGLKKIFRDLRLFVHIYEQEVIPGIDPKLKQLATQDCLHLRQSCQHQLLHMEETSGLVEIARLGIMVFSFGVAYPIADNRPLKSLATKLGTALDETFKSSDDELPESDLLLWATMLGAIAGYPKEQHVYGQRLRLVSVKTRLYFWREVRAIMEKFVWMRAACEKAGRKLWMEALGQTEDSDGLLVSDSVESPDSAWSSGSE